MPKFKKDDLVTYWTWDGSLCGTGAEIDEVRDVEGIPIYRLYGISEWFNEQSLLLVKTKEEIS